MTFIRNTVFATGLAVAAGPAVAQTTWDFATPYGDGVFHTGNISQFAEEVTEATDGALAFTVHSAGSLFPHPEIKGAVRSMQVPIGEFFLSRLSNEDLAYGVDSQPFVATSYEQAQALWDAQKPVIAELLAAEGLMPLFSVPWPPQGLFTSGEIASVDDLNGLRFRAYNAQLEEFAQLAGAAPVQVEAPDIPQAFSTGQVDAMITSPSTGVNSKAWDFLSHYTPINAWVPKNIVVVNQRAFDRLPEEQQTAIMDAAAAAETRGWEMSQEEAETMTEELANNGITVYEPSEDLVSGLQGIGDEMLESWNESASEAAKEILNGFEG